MVAGELRRSFVVAGQVTTLGWRLHLELPVKTLSFVEDVFTSALSAISTFAVVGRGSRVLRLCSLLFIFGSGWERTAHMRTATVTVPILSTEEKIIDSEDQHTATFSNDVSGGRPHRGRCSGLRPPHRCTQF